MGKRKNFLAHFSFHFPRGFCFYSLSRHFPFSPFVFAFPSSRRGRTDYTVQHLLSLFPHAHILYVCTNSPKGVKRRREYAAVQKHFQQRAYVDTPFTSSSNQDPLACNGIVPQFSLHALDKVPPLGGFFFLPSLPRNNTENRPGRRPEENERGTRKRPRPYSNLPFGGGFSRTKNKKAEGEVGWMESSGRKHRHSA